jgi:hypothetical protein
MPSKTIFVSFKDPSAFAGSGETDGFGAASPAGGADGSPVRLGD